MQIIEQNLIQVQSYTCSNYTYFKNVIAESLNILLWNCRNTWLSVAFSVEKIKQMTKGAILVKKTGMWRTLWFSVKKTSMRLMVWLLVGMWLWVWFKSMRLAKG